MSKDHIKRTINLPTEYSGVTYQVDVYKVERPEDAPPGTTQEPWVYSITQVISSGGGKLFDDATEAMVEALEYLVAVYKVEVGLD